MFNGCEQISELTTGYAFRFPNRPEWTARLIEFIAAERLCCPFFNFELAFEPEQGPIWLRIHGQDGVKEFIEANMEISNLKTLTAK